MELTDGLGADAAFEAVGVPQTFELAADLDPPRRARREHRRSRQAGDAAPGEAVDPRRHDHDGAGRHVQHPAAHAACRERAAGPVAVRDPPVPARRHDGRLRHVRRRGHTGALKVVLYGPESTSAHKEHLATAVAS